MGYMADKVTGQPITMDKETYTAFAGLLDRVETESNIGGHISWCDPLHVLRDRGIEGLELVVKVLEDYGFIVSHDDDELVIESWGGDKVGCSWDPMWRAIGDVVTEPVKWLMRGEDGDVWVELCVPGKGREQVGIDVDAMLDKAFRDI